MIRTITVTEAARGFADVINRIVYRRESALLMRGGKPVAKIIPVEETAKTGSELASVWMTLGHLTPAEADIFDKDVASGGKSLPPLVSKWD
jgi:antitoxin (DNA-binding transcriptional repressor) of toxin-antitoxin stability system